MLIFRVTRRVGWGLFEACNCGESCARDFFSSPRRVGILNTENSVVIAIAGSVSLLAGKKHAIMNIYKIVSRVCYMHLVKLKLYMQIAL